MNIKRAVFFGLLLYFVSFVTYIVIVLLQGEVSRYQAPSLMSYISMWLVNIPLIFFLGKWYFRNVSPTVQHGLQLGVVAIGVALLCDALLAFVTVVAGQPVDAFVALYTDWKLYATIFEIILLTTYMGYEFDGTFTDRNL